MPAMRPLIPALVARCPIGASRLAPLHNVKSGVPVRMMSAPAAPSDLKQEK
jgi:hypothetical protein